MRGAAGAAPSCIGVDHYYYFSAAAAASANRQSPQLTRSYRATWVALDEEEAKKPIDKKALKAAAKAKMAAAAAEKEKAAEAPKEDAPPAAAAEAAPEKEPVAAASSGEETVTPEGGGDTGQEFVIPKHKDRPADTPAWQNPLHHNNPEMSKMFEEDFKDGEEMPRQPLPPLDGSNPPHIQKLADDILHLNMLELHELVNNVQEHFGWEDADLQGGGGMMMAGGGAAGAEAEEVEAVVEKTTFDLKLEGFDPKSKIKVIKEVRAMAGLGLKEAKELVEGAPKTVKKDMKKEEADELKEKLEAIGATVSVV